MASIKPWMLFDWHTDPSDTTVRLHYVINPAFYQLAENRTERFQRLENISVFIDLPQTHGAIPTIRIAMFVIDYRNRGTQQAFLSFNPMDGSFTEDPEPSVTEHYLRMTLDGLHAAEGWEWMQEIVEHAIATTAKIVTDC